MSKNWYPVVDYLECAECGLCVQRCPLGVYDTRKMPLPVVINPDKCIEGCHTCGNNCPQGAIMYVGDRTGWQPPHGRKEEGEACCAAGCDCGCGCDCGEDETFSGRKTITIDFLYLDLATCDRCIGTHEALLSAVDAVGSVLKSAGYSVVVNKVEISSEQLAGQYRFLSSPTVRINGRDICLAVRENKCACCSNLSDQPVDCRVFEYEGKEYEVPPNAMIVDAMLRAVYGNEPEAEDESDYTIPENLKNFFRGKEKKKTSCCCGGC
jgi:NAD-dependent dihydropyrimidine dehydrogenase PreA subunit